MIPTNDRVIALTALQKLVRDELDKTRADAKYEMLEQENPKEDVCFCGKKVGDVRLITEQLSHIEVYPSTPDPKTVWSLFVEQNGGDEKQVITELLGNSPPTFHVKD